jgi:hypothetical protein
MTRHWTVSIDGGAPVHLDLAQYVAAIERAKQEGKPARVMIEANSGKTTEDRDMSAHDELVERCGHQHV